MILNLLLSPIELLINRVINDDPNARQKIALQKGQVIKINCTDWKIIFFILFQPSGLQFEAQYAGKVNTEISGTWDHFFKLILHGADQRALFAYPIEIKGDTHNIEVLRDAIKNNDYDLEEQISKVLGDAVAHKIVFHARETKNTVVNSLEKLKNSAKEFIYYETKSFPTKKQIERFYVDVAVLRNDVDRLEARMHQLILNKQKN